MFVGGLIADPPAEPVIANINVPNLELDEIDGWELCEVGKEPPRSMASATLIPTDDPNLFGVAERWGEPVVLPDHTDGGAVERDRISVTYLTASRPRAAHRSVEIGSRARRPVPLSPGASVRTPGDVVNEITGARESSGTSSSIVVRSTVS